MDGSWIQRSLLENLGGMIDGSIGLVEGCRALVALMGSLPPEIAASQPATWIAAVESETDMFPVGHARSLWDPDALRRGDEELAAYLAVVRDPTIEACLELRRMIEEGMRGPGVR